MLHDRSNHDVGRPILSRDMTSVRRGILQLSFISTRHSKWINRFKRPMDQ